MNDINSADITTNVSNEIHVLFVSASVADQTVLKALIAAEHSHNVSVTAAQSAEAFFDAMHSEQDYSIVIIDEQQKWAEWKTLVGASARNRPSALIVLLAAAAEIENNDAIAPHGVAAVYPKSSAGIIALSRLLSKIGSQNNNGKSGASPKVARVPDKKSADRSTKSGADDHQSLVYAVSHDLQDPLQLAKRYADMLSADYESQLDETGADILGHLQFNLERTQQMLDELLDYSRIENAAPEKTPVDLNELLDEVLELYRLTLDDLGAKVNVGHDLPTLHVDRRHFHRVFQNLIGNAIKFRGTEPLRITVRGKLVGNAWRIGFKDNGIGLDQKDAKRVFGMFERAADVADLPGTGMGLAICKRIVKNHGGRIWVRSTPGSGSAFIFSLPVEDRDDEFLGYDNTVGIQ